MKRILVSIIALMLCGFAHSRAPLQESRYGELPLGSIKPSGWLLEQLRRQASGLTGHLDEVYPQVMGPSNAWKGGDGDAWERGPYWLDGLVPLAWILDDEALKAKAMEWIEPILTSAQADGYFGPSVDNPFVYGLQRGQSHDWWPKMVALKALKQYYMATGDPRVVSLMLGYFRYQLENLPSTPLDHWTDWGRWRGADNLEVVYWLYDLTGEAFLLDLGSLLYGQTAPWEQIISDGSHFYTQHSLHAVNLAEGFKAPAVGWLGGLCGQLDPSAVWTLVHGTIGLPNGLWAGDELTNHGSPERGSELCTAVEMMFSLEETLRITGVCRWADWLERVAYNALPTQINDDFTAKQYYQQTNQIACTRAWRPFSTPHDDTDVVFGTLNGYPCCLSNMHQGWPKFTQNLWYSTVEGGLAALLYAPCSVSATVGDVDVTIVEETAYPFDGAISIRVSLASAVEFPLELRVPSWASSYELRVNGEACGERVGDVLVVNRLWQDGDTVELSFPMPVTVEEEYDGAWSILRGPLVYALRMKEIRSHGRFSDKYYGKGYERVRSRTRWNYCLMRDSFSADDCRVEVRDMASAYPWNLKNAPVSIFVPARRLPAWKACNGSIGPIPYWTEDGNDTGKPATLELIPYGCTTLRIAAFPTRIVPWDLELRKVEVADW